VCNLQHLLPAQPRGTQNAPHVGDNFALLADYLIADCVLKLELLQADRLLVFGVCGVWCVWCVVARIDDFARVGVIFLLPFLVTGLLVSHQHAQTTANPQDPLPKPNPPNQPNSSHPPTCILNVDSIFKKLALLLPSTAASIFDWMSRLSDSLAAMSSRYL